MKRVISVKSKRANNKQVATLEI